MSYGLAFLVVALTQGSVVWCNGLTGLCVLGVLGGYPRPYFFVFCCVLPLNKVLHRPQSTVAIFDAYLLLEILGYFTMIGFHRKMNL